MLFGDSGVALLPGSAFGMAETSLTARLAFVDFDGNKALAGGDLAEIFAKMEAGVLALCKWLEEL